MIALALPLLLAAVALGPTPLPGPATPPPSVSPLPIPSSLPTQPAVQAQPTRGASLSAHPTSPEPRGERGRRTPLPLATVGPPGGLYLYRFVPGQPDRPAADQPQIFAVYINGKTLHSLGPIDIRVVTSANVVKVTSSSNGRTGSLAEIGPGDFQAHSGLPKIPRIAAGITTTLDFTASSSDGKAVTVGVPIQLL